MRISIQNDVFMSLVKSLGQIYITIAQYYSQDTIVNWKFNI